MQGFGQGGFGFQSGQSSMGFGSTGFGSSTSAASPFASTNTTQGFGGTQSSIPSQGFGTGFSNQSAPAFIPLSQSNPVGGFGSTPAFGAPGFAAPEGGASFGSMDFGGNKSNAGGFPGSSSESGWVGGSFPGATTAGGFQRNPAGARPSSYKPDANTWVNPSAASMSSNSSFPGSSAVVGGFQSMGAAPGFVGSGSGSQQEGFSSNQPPFGSRRRVSPTMLPNNPSARLEDSRNFAANQVAERAMKRALTLPNSAASTPNQTKLFIRLHDGEWDENVIRNKLSQFGKVASVWFKPGKKVSYAQMSTPAEALNAVTNASDRTWAVVFDKNVGPAPASTYSAGGGYAAHAAPSVRGGPFHTTSHVESSLQPPGSKFSPLVSKSSRLQRHAKASSGSETNVMEDEEDEPLQLEDEEDVNSDQNEDPGEIGDEDWAPEDEEGCGDAEQEEGEEEEEDEGEEEDDEDEAEASEDEGLDEATPTTRASLPTPAFEDLGGKCVGLCTTMCPVEETDQRIRENQIHPLERPHESLPALGSDPYALTIKMFQRSAAGKKMDEPSQVRTETALDETIWYIWREVLDLDRKGPDPRLHNTVPAAAFVYSFINDRTRMVRKDFSLQGYQDEDGVVTERVLRVYEECARFHIAAEYEFCEEETSTEGYSASLNRQDLNNTLKTLMEMYDRATFVPKNEAQFRAFYILLNVDAKDRLSSNSFVRDCIVRGSKELLESRPMKLALAVYEARQSGDYHTYFRYLRSELTTFLEACLMHSSLTQARFKALSLLNNVSHASMNNTLSVESVAQALCFELPAERSNMGRFLMAVGLAIDDAANTVTLGAFKPLPEEGLEEFSRQASVFVNRKCLDPATGERIARVKIVADPSRWEGESLPTQVPVKEKAVVPSFTASVPRPTSLLRADAAPFTPATSTSAPIFSRPPVVGPVPFTPASTPNVVARALISSPPPSPAVPPLAAPARPPTILVAPLSAPLPSAPPATAPLATAPPASVSPPVAAAPAQPPPRRHPTREAVDGCLRLVQKFYVRRKAREFLKVWAAFHRKRAHAYHRSVTAIFRLREALLKRRRLLAWRRITQALEARTHQRGAAAKQAAARQRARTYLRGWVDIVRERARRSEESRLAQQRVVDAFNESLLDDVAEAALDPSTYERTSQSESERDPEDREFYQKLAETMPDPCWRVVVCALPSSFQDEGERCFLKALESVAARFGSDKRVDLQVINLSSGDVGLRNFRGADAVVVMCDDPSSGPEAGRVGDLVARGLEVAQSGAVSTVPVLTLARSVDVATEASKLLAREGRRVVVPSAWFHHARPAYRHHWIAWLAERAPERPSIVVGGRSLEDLVCRSVFPAPNPGETVTSWLSRGNSKLLALSQAYEREYSSIQWPLPQQVPRDSELTEGWNALEVCALAAKSLRACVLTLPEEDAIFERGDLLTQFANSNGLDSHVLETLMTRFAIHSSQSNPTVEDVHVSLERTWASLVLMALTTKAQSAGRLLGLPAQRAWFVDVRHIVDVSLSSYTASIQPSMNSSLLSEPVAQLSDAPALPTKIVETTTATKKRPRPVEDKDGSELASKRSEWTLELERLVATGNEPFDDEQVRRTKLSALLWSASVPHEL